jgi:hypothetical protein
MQVVPLSAAAGIPAPAAPGPPAPPGISDAASESTKAYQAAVSRDIEAMVTRKSKIGLRKNPINVIRKTKANAQCP